MGDVTNLYKGFQTVVPANIRKKLNLDLDYILEWNISDENKVEVEFRKKTNVNDLIGIFSSKEPTDAVDLQRKMRNGEDVDIP
ncbi:MAG: hypothetical protein LBM96_05150 [Methanobrevibacter sp.]|jgi:bifunctional DNA-binding transcriptional regulator/antitoxin component of YhaV-PrlF toxin-antitoxin module|nr:hypothetical protein [Candidatus Methanoflexus mossambicus]